MEVKNTKLSPENFIDFLEKESERHLKQKGVDIGDRIAWGYISNLINNYKKGF